MAKINELERETHAHAHTHTHTHTYTHTHGVGVNTIQEEGRIITYERQKKRFWKKVSSRAGILGMILTIRVLNKT